MNRRGRHRHIHVDRTRIEGTVEDRYDVPRIGGVNNRAASHRLQRLRDIRRTRRINRDRRETGISDLVDDTLRTINVDVREHHPFEKLAARSD